MIRLSQQVIRHSQQVIRLGSGEREIRISVATEEIRETEIEIAAAIIDVGLEWGEVLRIEHGSLVVCHACLVRQVHGCAVFLLYLGLDMLLLHI